MPELMRNQQFFLLQPPPNQHHQLKETNHQNLDCFLPYQFTSSPSSLGNTNLGANKQPIWPYHWNSTSNNPNINNINNSTHSHNSYPQYGNYSSSSPPSSCCSSCCSSPTPTTNMNYYPFNYCNSEYSSDVDIICVIDFEATTDKCYGRRIPNDLIMEIIEFPVFFLDTRERKVLGTFHEYVRPIVNPELSKFCTALTGITQHAVDQADIFPNVLERFEKKIANLLKETGYSTFAIATDGPWDITHFLARSCQIHGLEIPSYAKRYINLKRTYADFYQLKPICLDNMFHQRGIRFEGRRHSGYFDALHITKLLLKFWDDGAIVARNEQLSWDVSGRKCWGNMTCGYIPYEPINELRYL